MTPKWVRETVWYQIFPERFCNGNKRNDPDWVKPWGYHTVSNLDFYGGDLDGIRQKLPYLQELGITGLYLTPVFESPQVINMIRQITGRSIRASEMKRL